MEIRRCDEAENLSKKEGRQRKEVVNTLGGDEALSANVHSRTNRIQTNHEDSLMKKMVTSDNLNSAYKRVRRNKGAAGIDGMTTDDLGQHLKENKLALIEQLLNGTYQPHPVRRVEIPKPGGGMRLLGIPTVTDRFVQQAMLHILTPIFEPLFSESSYGFRPGRSAHQAVRKAQELMNEGRNVVVDIDIEKFFDQVNHDVLMGIIMRYVTDKRMLSLIRKFLRAGIMLHGWYAKSEEGTPQGGPLSPLLANVLLNELDKELEKRGHKFVRYADDCNIYVSSMRAGRRLMDSIKEFLQRKLRLKVNAQKSAVDRPAKRKFLGFSFYRKESKALIRIHPETIVRFKGQVRELTRGHQNMPLSERIQKLNEYTVGWRGYFAIAQTPSVLARLDEWIRRRLRMCLLKQWRRCKTRMRELTRAGARTLWAGRIAFSRKGYWRLANTPQLNGLFDIKYWKEQGLAPLL